MSSEAAEVHGRCEPAFESLRRALADIIDAGSEVGAALAVYVGKQSVVVDASPRAGKRLATWSA